MMLTGIQASGMAVMQLCMLIDCSKLTEHVLCLATSQRQALAGMQHGVTCDGCKLA